MKLLYEIFGVSYTTVQTMKLLYETSLYLLSFPAQIMHETFVNMVLNEEDEMVVPLCLIVIALAMQHHKWAVNNTKLLDKQVYSTKKYIWG